jgi:predicted secreted protein
MAITTAKGTLLKISDTASPAAYASMSQVKSISGPTTKPKIVDVTAHSTAGFWAAKLAVLIEAGDISFDVNFDKSDATMSFTTGLWAQMVGLILTGIQMVFPNAAGTLTFQGYTGSHEFNAPVDNVLSAKMQIAITGAITAA